MLKTRTSATSTACATASRCAHALEAWYGVCTLGVVSRVHSRRVIACDVDRLRDRFQVRACAQGS